MNELSKLNKIIANLTSIQISEIKNLSDEEKLYIFTHGRFKQEMIKNLDIEDQKLIVDNNIFLNYNNNIKRDFINKNPELGAKLVPSLLKEDSPFSVLKYCTDHVYVLYEVLLHDPSFKDNYDYLTDSDFWKRLTENLTKRYINNKSIEFLNSLDNILSLARLLGLNSDKSYSKFLSFLITNFNNIKKYKISESNIKIKNDILEYYFNSNNWHFNNKIYKLFRCKTPEEEKRFLMNIDFNVNTLKDIRHVRVKHNQDLMTNIRTVMELKKQ